MPVRATPVTGRLPPPGADGDAEAAELPSTVPDPLGEGLPDWLGLEDGDSEGEDEGDGECDGDLDGDGDGDGDGDPPEPTHVWVRLKNLALVVSLSTVALPSSSVQPDGTTTHALLAPLVVMPSGYGSDESGIETVTWLPPVVRNVNVRVTKWASFPGSTKTHPSEPAPRFPTGI
jgi:hypothetical protein